MRFLLQSFISFFLGVVINDLSESNTTLKTSIGKIDILETHSSFQFDLEFKTLILLIFLTTIIVISFYEKNKDRFLKSLLLKLVHFEVIFFLFIKGLNYNSFYKESQIIYVLIIILVILFIGILYKTKENDEEKETINSLSKRKSDIERLNVTLEISNIVGINSIWGFGKTFLIEQWLKIYKKKNYIIISLLNVESDDILKAIFFELDKILMKNGKIGFHSSKIKTFCNNQTIFSFNLYGLFSNLTQKEAILDYRKTLEKLNEEIFIIFDDLDRIDNILKIKKVLNFGAEFSSDRIKIIYLYDQNKLEILDENLNKSYLEKFIPLNFSLTKISYQELFEYYSEKYKSQLDLYYQKNDFLFLKYILNFNSTSYSDESGNLKEDLKKELLEYIDFFYIFKKTFKIDFDEINFRKMEIFFKEIIYLKKLLEKKLEIKKIQNRVIIGVSFFKVFFPEIFEVMSNGGLIENNFDLKITINGETSNLSQIKIYLKRIQSSSPQLNKAEISKINEIFKLSLKTGGYSINIFEKIDFEKCIDIKKYYPYIIFNFPVSNESENLKDKRMQLNREINKIISIGNLELESNYEYFCNKFKEISNIKDPKERLNFYYKVFYNQENIHNKFSYGAGVVAIDALMTYSNAKSRDLKLYIEMILVEKIYDSILEKVGDFRVLANYELREMILKWFLQSEIDKDRLTKLKLNEFIFNLYKTIVDYELEEMDTIYNQDINQYKNSMENYISTSNKYINDSKLMQLKIFKKQFDLIKKVVEKYRSILDNNELPITAVVRIPMEEELDLDYENKLNELKNLSNKKDIYTELDKLYTNTEYRKYNVESFINRLKQEKKL